MPVAVDQLDTASQAGSAAIPPALPLPYAVRGFFENGGTLAYIVAVKDSDAGCPAPSTSSPGCRT